MTQNNVQLYLVSTSDPLCLFVYIDSFSNIYLQHQIQRDNNYQQVLFKQIYGQRNVKLEEEFIADLGLIYIKRPTIGLDKKTHISFVANIVSYLYCVDLLVDIYIIVLVK